MRAVAVAVLAIACSNAPSNVVATLQETVAQVERHWAGLRPGSRDGIPYICPHPLIHGLYINTGHYRNGVILAPGSARLMADLILGRESILDARDYALNNPIMAER